MPGPYLENEQIDLAYQLLDPKLLGKLIPIDWTELAHTPELPSQALIEAIGQKSHPNQNNHLLDDEDKFSSYLIPHHFSLFAINRSLIEKSMPEGKMYFCVRECDFITPNNTLSKMILIDRVLDTSCERVGFFVSGKLIYPLTHPQPSLPLSENTCTEETTTPQMRFESALEFLAQKSNHSTQKIQQILIHLQKWQHNISFNFLNKIARLISQESGINLDVYNEIVTEMEQAYSIRYKKLPLASAAFFLMIGLAFGLALFFSPFSIGLGALAIAALGFTTCVVLSACVMLASLYVAYRTWETNRFLVPLHNELNAYQQSIITKHQEAPELPTLKNPIDTKIAVTTKSCLKKKESNNTSCSHKMVRYSYTTTVGFFPNTHNVRGKRSKDSTVTFTQEKLKIK